MFDLFLRLLASQLGQVSNGGEEEGEETAGGDGGLDQNAQTSDDTGTETEGAIQGQAEAKPQQEESFISPNELPDELKPHWKRMHRTYTKRLEEIKGVRDQAAQVQRFFNDKEFAFNTLAQWAAQNGYTVSPVNAQGQQTAAKSQAQGVQAPPELIDAVKSRLSPELQWMAESIADAQWAAQQLAFKPLIQQQQQQQQAQLNQEYDQLADELTQTAPGWEEHEADMLEILNFFTSPQLRHQKYGSKLKLLYNMLTGNAQAVVETTQRMTRAVKNRSSSSLNQGRTVPNLADRIRKADKNSAWDLAAQAALSNVTGLDD